MSQKQISFSPWGSLPLFSPCPPFRGTRRGKDTDTAEEDMVLTTARITAAAAGY